MAISERGKQFVADHEGCPLKAYKCPAGVWTIGLGHTSAAGLPKVTPGMTITRVTAFEIFDRDAIKYEQRVISRLGKRSETQHTAAFSFDYNTGAILRAGWVQQFLNGAITKADNQLRTTYVTGGGKRLKGLVRRRGEEADLFFHDKWPRTQVRAQDAPYVSNAKEEIKAYQTDLKTLGYYKGEPDGFDGPLTDAAVRQFQRANNMTVDGIVGPATRATIIRRLNDRKDKQVTGGAAAGGGVAGDPSSFDPTNVDVSFLHDVNMLYVIAGAVILGVVVYVGLKLWRNRGKVTGKRIKT